MTFFTAYDKHSEKIPTFVDIRRNLPAIKRKRERKRMISFHRRGDVHHYLSMYANDERYI